MDTVLFQKENIDLTFYGMDTYADVYLNDSLILKADNMFRTWTIACKEILHPPVNHLKIMFANIVFILIGQNVYETHSVLLPKNENIFNCWFLFMFAIH